MNGKIARFFYLVYFSMARMASRVIGDAILFFTCLLNHVLYRRQNGEAKSARLQCGALRFAMGFRK